MAEHLRSVVEQRVHAHAAAAAAVPPRAYMYARINADPLLQLGVGGSAALLVAMLLCLCCWSVLRVGPGRRRRGWQAATKGEERSGGEATSSTGERDAGCKAVGEEEDVYAL